ncbi:hypothetical protein APA_2311 [Pseudanabaena sp. lw0831]|nr:hypothetical protein APA_2311 [Pseudanabaena sp. lw0831]
MSSNIFTKLAFLPELISGFSGREISTEVGVLGVVLGLVCDLTGVATANIAVVIAVKVISDRAANFLMTQMYWF